MCFTILDGVEVIRKLLSLDIEALSVLFIGRSLRGYLFKKIDIYVRCSACLLIFLDAIHL